MKIKRCFETKVPIDEYILTQLNKQFKMFLIVGGMSRIVDEYVKEKSLGKVMSLQKSNLRLECFKIYVRDTGLLMSMYEEGIQKDILNDELYINEGAILENVCAEEIQTRYNDVYINKFSPCMKGVRNARKIKRIK